MHVARVRTQDARHSRYFKHPNPHVHVLCKRKDDFYGTNDIPGGDQETTVKNTDLIGRQTYMFADGMVYMYV